MDSAQPGCNSIQLQPKSITFATPTEDPRCFGDRDRCGLGTAFRALGVKRRGDLVSCYSGHQIQRHNPEFAGLAPAVLPKKGSRISSFSETGSDLGVSQGGSHRIDSLVAEYGLMRDF